MRGRGVVYGHRTFTSSLAADCLLPSIFVATFYREQSDSPVPAQAALHKSAFLSQNATSFLRKPGIQSNNWTGPFQAGSLCQDQLGPGAWPRRYQAKASRFQYLLVARDVESGIEMGDRLRRHADNLAGLLAESAQRGQEPCELIRGGFPGLLDRLQFRAAQFARQCLLLKGTKGQEIRPR